MVDLLKYKDWLRITAFGLNPNMADDLAQEGMIAMWKAEKEWDPDRCPLESWLYTAARFRMRRVLQDSMTRKGGRGEQPVWSPRYVPIPPEVFLSSGVDSPVWMDLGAIELAYHHGELYEALNALTPRQREYVYLRFWLRATGVEMRAHFGYDPGALWTSSRNGARGKLQTALAHLAG